MVVVIFAVAKVTVAAVSDALGTTNASVTTVEAVTEIGSVITVAAEAAVVTMAVFAIAAEAITAALLSFTGDLLCDAVV